MFRTNRLRIACLLLGLWAICLTGNAVHAVVHGDDTDCSLCIKAPSALISSSPAIGAPDAPRPAATSSSRQRPTVARIGSPPQRGPPALQA